MKGHIDRQAFSYTYTKMKSSPITNSTNFCLKIIPMSRLATKSSLGNTNCLMIHHLLDIGHFEIINYPDLYLVSLLLLTSLTTYEESKYSSNTELEVRDSHMLVVQQLASFS